MKKNSYLIIFFLFICLKTYPQKAGVISKTSNGQSLDFIPVSPNAAGLGAFGQVPVSFYNGLPQINVPFYNVNYKELSIPLGISYNAAGNKPDDFPGSVGLGWSLDAPWAITRVVNGRVDEGGDVPNDNDPNILNSSIPLTSRANWGTTGYLDSLLKRNTLDFTDGSNPDEYYFSFNGSSGRFYFDHEGNPHVRSTDGSRLKIEKTVLQAKRINVSPMDQSLYEAPKTILDVYIAWSNNKNRTKYEASFLKEAVIYKFVITAGNGIKYTFGGTDESIEFSRPGFVVGEGNGKPTSKYINSSSWYLTSIESPNGYKIDLTYERGVSFPKS